MEDGSKGKLYACSSALHVYMLDPRSDSTIAQLNTLFSSMLDDPAPQPLSFIFDATCHGIHNHGHPIGQHFHAKVMNDSGATTRFASLAWVQHNKLPIKPSHKNWTVKVADNSTVTVIGTVDVNIKSPSYTKEKNTFYTQNP